MGYFDALSIDRWFKSIMYFAGVIFVLSLVRPIQILTNEAIAASGAGLFLYGLGRWKNEKTLTGIQDAGYRGIFKYSQKQRKPDIVGLILEIIGIVFIAFAMYRIVTNAPL